MMRCVLYSADLGSEYWSYVLRLAVYIRNHLSHSSIKTIPFHELTWRKPDGTKRRFFGSRVCAHVLRVDKFPKLGHENTNGIFLGYKASDNNIYYEDDNS